jgi:hypothetical protein
MEASCSNAVCRTSDTDPGQVLHDFLGNARCIAAKPH